MAKNNITFVIRCTPDRAIQILNRMFACGEISKEYSEARIREIDSQRADAMDADNIKKQKIMNEILRNPRTFYKKSLKK